MEIAWNKNVGVSLQHQCKQSEKQSIRVCSCQPWQYCGAQRQWQVLKRAFWENIYWYLAFFLSISFWSHQLCSDKHSVCWIKTQRDMTDSCQTKGKTEIQSWQADHKMFEKQQVPNLTHSVCSGWRRSRENSSLRIELRGFTFYKKPNKQQKTAKSKYKNLMVMGSSHTVAEDSKAPWSLCWSDQSC